MGDLVCVRERAIDQRVRNIDGVVSLGCFSFFKCSSSSSSRPTRSPPRSRYAIVRQRRCADAVARRDFALSNPVETRRDKASNWEAAAAAASQRREQEGSSVLPTRPPTPLAGFPTSSTTPTLFLLFFVLGSHRPSHADILPVSA